MLYTSTAFIAQMTDFMTLVQTFEQAVLCDTAAGRAAQLTPAVTAGLTAAAADHRQGQLCQL